MTKNIIVAISDNYAIGKDGKMPWHIKEDLKSFKKITSGHPVIMGRKTYESIGKPLPNRTNIVLTHKYIDGVIPVESLDQAYQIAEEYDTKCFVIGGAKIYESAMKDADEMYITHIHTVVEDADTFFPTIDMNIWKLYMASDVKTDPESGLKYNFEIYIRK